MWTNDIIILVTFMLVFLAILICLLVLSIADGVKATRELQQYLNELIFKKIKL